MRKPKVLLHSHFVPEKPKKLDDLMLDEIGMTERSV